MTDFFENLVNRFNENIKEETRDQIKLRLKEAIKKAETTNQKEIFNTLCNKYQNLLYLANDKDFNDFIVNSFALVISLNKNKSRK